MSFGDIGRCEEGKSVYEIVRTYIKADSAFDVKSFTEHECIKRFMLRKIFIAVQLFLFQALRP